MNVTIRQLHCFVAVARSGSFAEACSVLHLSQPALSIAIRNLETGIGGKLLERSTRSVTLTPEGAKFYPVVQRLLEDWERSLDDVRNLFALRRGKLDIAAVPTFASSLLPNVLAEFHRCFPDINISVHDVITESVVEMVRQNRVELGITFDPGKADDLSFTPLFRDRFIKQCCRPSIRCWQSGVEVGVTCSNFPTSRCNARPVSACSSTEYWPGMVSPWCPRLRRTSWPVSADGDRRSGDQRGTDPEPQPDAGDGRPVPAG